MDGFQICKTLWKNPDWILMADTPVLLMTGIYDTMEGRREEIEERLRAVGADGLIVKPFDPAEAFLEEETEEPILLEAASEVVEPLVPPTEGEVPGPSFRPVAGAVDLAEVARQIVQDPEFIRQVAERVVRHLSQTTLEDIAWQVVPELAEQLIQRRLKEKGL